MRFVFVGVVASALVAATASLAGAADAVDVQSRIDAVTVFPSGAEVVRTARVKIPQGAGTLVFKDLPAEAVAQSIRVDGKSTGELEIGTVDVRRLFVPQHDGAQSENERKQIEKEIEGLEDERKLAEARVSAADTQRTLIGNLTNLPNRPAPAAGLSSPGENWGEIIKLIEANLTEIAKARLDAETRVRDLERRISDLRGKLAALAPVSEERTEVLVAVKAGQALDTDLTVRYQVPNASWSPSYDARLSTGSKTAQPALVVTRRATITQQTGEPWENVAIQLSTTRPNAGTAAPELGSLAVNYPLPPRPVPMAAPAPAAQQRGFADKVGEEMDAAAEVALGAMKPKRMARRSMAVVQVAAFQATYAVPDRASVMNTGEAKSLDLANEKLTPALLVRAVPKRDAKAYLYAKIEVPRGSPMLPGQIALFRDGTFVGNGRLPLLAGGETHELGFGSDDFVKVRHAVVKESRGETGIISSSKTDERNYRLAVKNMHERAIDVSIFDQLPVSGNEEIKVDLIGRPQPSERDVDHKTGVLRWDAKLEADEEKIIEFGYRVTWPAAKAIEYTER
ncbi:MAG: mucoidy inhibitor MuiA family protein [Hyphomicrobiaceae bacterium]|nr:mucoidy inhibitor MuiA family protein [Hyphomicrobiaceae bacterium]